jgi:hypothetical protein
MRQTCNVLLPYDSSKRCVCSLYKFVNTFEVVNLFLRHCIFPGLTIIKNSASIVVVVVVVVVVIAAIVVMTYAWPPGNFKQHLPLKIVAPAKQGSQHHWKFYKDDTGPRFAFGFGPSLCIRLQKYAANKEKPYKITWMNMFAVQDKVKPDTENIRGLNLAAFNLTTVRVTKLPV